MNDRWTTPWYKWDVLPVIVGVYERKANNGLGVVYSFWDGYAWCRWGRSAREAYGNWMLPLPWTKWPWRGLKEPK